MSFLQNLDWGLLTFLNFLGEKHGDSFAPRFLVTTLKSGLELLEWDWECQRESEQQLR